MDSTQTMNTKYDASQVETRWYEQWEKAGLFQPEEGSKKPNYTITIPPPNITGSLHMGHALCYPIQDLLGRFWRLSGKNVWIVPGQDHAGIAAQSVVDKQLRKEGTSAIQLGRDKFLERAWEWRHESGNTILSQLRSLGCAFDWTNTHFTLDPHYVQAVLKVFIEWYDRGLIYKGKRVVNWDPVLETSVSDIETERKMIKGKLYHVRYPFSDGSGHVVIATTRPETMLADVAVAVNPKDERYKGLVGKILILPLANREIPLIEDRYADPEFGTGALKITPSHDANDFEVGKRHDLPMPVVMDSKAKINELGGIYAGLDRYEARKRIVADLEEQGYLVKVEDHEIAMIVSERSGANIEPLLSEQWFVKQTELAKPVIEAVQQGKIKFTPERYNEIFLDWMVNIKDWCISRQLWWGHRVPIYFTADGQAFAAHTQEEAQIKAGVDNPIVRQEEDVLDTWFSSGLWPFVTLGWPQEKNHLKDRYPTSVLVTDRNIINLWVARMAMMGMDFLSEVPFHEVFIYATVLTEDGRRMSKSLGTGVDPMEIIPKYGADALRYILLSQTGANQDIRYSERKTEEARNFCNKIWNAARFVLMHLDGQMPEKPTQLDVVDQWILSRLYQTEQVVRKAYEGYDFQVAAQTLQNFFWSELCDWYIEVSKDRLQDASTKQTPQWVLATVLDTYVKMMHPIMPFITEEIYHHLPCQNKSEFLMSSEWPVLSSEFAFEEVGAKIERWFTITRSLRALRAEVGLTPLKEIPEVWYEGDIQEGAALIASQAWIAELKKGKPTEAKFISNTIEGVDLYLPVSDLIDMDKELSRLSKEQEKLEKELSGLENRLNNPQFIERAKPEIVEREKANAEDLKDRLIKLEERKKLFSN